MIRFSEIIRGFSFSVAVLSVWGQSFSGTIGGLIRDSTSAAIPGVSITILNEGTGAQRRLLSDTSGNYVAAELPVGYYTVRFESAGLGKAERQKVKVDVGSETRVDVSLSAQV